MKCEIVFGWIVFFFYFFKIITLEAHLVFSVRGFHSEAAAVPINVPFQWSTTYTMYMTIGYPKIPHG